MNIGKAAAMGQATVSNLKNIGNALKGDLTNNFNNSDTNQIGDPKNISPIEWNDYNYPPVLRLYHYQTSGIKSKTLSVIKKMRVAADLIFIIAVINLFNNIIQMTSDCKLIQGSQIWYSIFGKLNYSTHSNQLFICRNGTMAKWCPSEFLLWALWYSSATRLEQ